MGYLQDPRVLFAAERSALAWNRSCLALMAFGFAIERFGLYLQLVAPAKAVDRFAFSFWMGIAFVALGVVAALLSAWQYHRTLDKLDDEEIPAGYRVHLATWLNISVGLLGVALLLYLSFSS